MQTSSRPQPSKAKVISTHGQTRLVDCESISPIRFLHPYFTDQAVSLIMSSYGGGMVQGDQVEIEIDCTENAKLFLGTQSNSRVYKNDQDLTTTQQLRGKVGPGARTVFLPDPLVLHSGSRFHQQQSWTVAPDAGLLVGEWFQCGRSDSGECFAYQEYDSLIEISSEEALWIREAFSSTPNDYSPRQTGRFGDANLMLTLFAVGEAQALLTRALETLTAGQREYTQVPVLGEKELRPSPSDLRSLTHLEDRPVSIFRALGVTRADFDPIWQALQTQLASPNWLGIDAQLPMCRQMV
ncbi:urease accessory protein UreD [Kiritimatiellota bacterium B12222]|nr:urease accessory protein UreD [Kiritimatiellota bacterium B12222]